MNLSKTKINLFFLSLVLLGWFLYPKALFLGYLYEGREDLQKSEYFYLDYLKKYPHSKIANLRLARLYERSAKPELGVKLLESLVDYRSRDWEVAEFYLNYLENLHDEKALYTAQLKIARRMLKEPHFSKKRAEALLVRAYNYALWDQKLDDAYQIMLELSEMGANKKDYLTNLESLDWGLKKTNNLLKIYEAKIREQPNDLDIISELTGLYRVLNRTGDAYAIIDARLAVNPQNIDLLILRSYLDDDSKNTGALASDLTKIVSLTKVGTTQWSENIRQLIGVLGDQKKFNQALVFARQVLSEENKNPNNWFLVFSLLSELRSFDELLLLLDEFDIRFPGDLKSLDLRLSIYLYEKKEWDHLDFYRNYIHLTSKKEVAKEVAYLMQQDRAGAVLEKWLVEMNHKFAGDSDFLLMLSDLYIKQNNWDKALVVLNEYKGSELSVLLNKAFVLASLGRREDAINIFENLGLRAHKERGLYTLMGREILFLGNPKKAVIYLQKALDQNNNDSEAHFWLGEAYFSTLQEKLSPVHFEQVIKLLEKKKKLSLEEEREWLKSRGRIYQTDQLARDYEVAFKKYPDNKDFASDWLDLLLQEEKFRTAATWLNIFKNIKPIEPNRWLPYEVRLAFGRGEWGKASRLLEQILKNEPQNNSYRRDLADAYLKQGYWVKAAREIVLVRDGAPHDIEIAPLIHLIHDRFDNQIHFNFEFVDAGSENYFRETLGVRQSVSERYYLKASADFGQFESGFTGFNRNYEAGLIGAGFYMGEGWRLEGAFRVTHTESGNTYAPILEFDSPQDLDFLFRLKGTYRDLNVNSASLMTLGDVQSGIEFDSQYAIGNKIVLGLHHDSYQHQTDSGKKSYVFNLVPSLNGRILSKPDLVIGYEYHFEEAFNNDWVKTTGFIKRLNAHYLVLNAGYEFNDRFSMGGNLFVGEDVTRHLHFYQGDLWGASARVLWWPNAWLQLEGHYEFGQETLSQLSGRSHKFVLGVTGHWW